MNMDQYLLHWMVSIRICPLLDIALEDGRSPELRRNTVDIDISLSIPYTWNELNRVLSQLEESEGMDLALAFTGDLRLIENWN